MQKVFTSSFNKLTMSEADGWHNWIGICDNLILNLNVQVAAAKVISISMTAVLVVVVYFFFFTFTLDEHFSSAS